MADSAVEFLMENLKQLLVYNGRLILGVKDNVELLYKELETLKAVIKDSSERNFNSYEAKNLVKDIREVTYDAEDVIDVFVTEAAVRKAQKGLKKLFNYLDYPATIRGVAKRIEELRGKVKDLYEQRKLGSEATQAGDTYSRGMQRGRCAPTVEEENVVGFEKEISMLIDRLTGPQEELDIVTVIGMGGLGKTTLAKKVFTHPTIDFKFPTRAWVYVSEDYNRHDVFISILRHVTTITDDMYKMSDDELAAELSRHLEKRKYLIVLDDVWTPTAWDHLQSAFPRIQNKNGSRIILTSRNRDVGVHAGSEVIHPLRFLDPEESWKLLNHKVFRKETCPPYLEIHGRKIAEECKGLPLAIVVISGLLSKREKTTDLWTKVAQRVESFVAKEESGRCNDVLALSYKHLPYHLKACFLYFGIFPEDFEIPVWKLIRLWVAEGFIQQKADELPEDIAEEHLEDLVDRNLVMVEKRSNGRIKTCRVHDMLRALCLKQAEEEIFFREVKNSFDPDSSSLVNSIKNKHRRICFHSNILKFVSSKPLDQRVRSLLCFASDRIKVPVPHLSFVSDGFKLTRVLDINPISFPRFPSQIDQLVHLRYIALSGEFKSLPATISNLWNLQTLILETSSGTLEIQADIWKLLHLRHLHTNVSSQLQGPAKGKKNEDTQVRSKIQTMSTISPESCTKNVLSRTPNLKKLGIRGNLPALVDVKGDSSLFDNLTKLESVKTMKLLNDTSSSKLRGLPQTYKFPTNLKKLTISNTLLDWEHMATLAMLPILEVLKVEEHAFSGSEWNPVDGGFKALKVLQIVKMDLERWYASADHFPRLERLVIKLCASLGEIPSALGHMSALQAMELTWPTPPVRVSAKKIQQQRDEEMKQQQEQQHIYGTNRFKLTVFPADYE